MHSYHLLRLNTVLVVRPVCGKQTSQNTTTSATSEWQSISQMRTKLDSGRIGFNELICVRLQKISSQFNCVGGSGTPLEMKYFGQTHVTVEQQTPSPAGSRLPSHCSTHSKHSSIPVIVYVPVLFWRSD